MTFQQKFSSCNLEQTGVTLKTYGDQTLPVLGKIQVDVRYEGQSYSLPMVVVRGKGVSLFGRDWMKHIRLDWKAIKKVHVDIESVLKRYQEVFESGLGTLKGVQAKLSLREDCSPKFFRPRTVPYALRDAVEGDLNRLEQLDIIDKVSHSDWASPIVPVPKADGSIRICGDFKVTINRR